MLMWCFDEFILCAHSILELISHDNLILIWFSIELYIGLVWSDHWSLDVYTYWMWYILIIWHWNWYWYDRISIFCPLPPPTHIYIENWCDLMTPMMGRVWSTIQCTEYLPFGANWTSRCSAGHWGRRRPRLYSQRMHGSDYTLYIIHYMDLRLYSCTVKRCTDLMTAVQRSVFDV